MGIGITDGDSLATALLAAAARCRNCGAKITAEAGLTTLSDIGITEDGLIACPECHAVFRMRLGDHLGDVGAESA